MIGFVIATAAEAQGLIRRLGARAVAGEPCETYAFPAGVIVISGMGKTAAAAGTEYLIDRHQVTTVINAGLCGDLRDCLRGGAMLAITDAIDGDRLLTGQADWRPCSRGAWASLPAARLASVDEPVFGDARRETLAGSADVVDMEGAAVAEVCRRRGISVYLLKGVSDRADAGGKADIQANIEAVSDKLAAAIVAGLAPAAPPRGGAVAGVMHFAKIEHSLFSLPLLFAGAWLGAGGTWPSLKVLGLIALAGVGARALGMAMNRILDRDLDARNPRTAARELPSGRMPLPRAYGVAAAGLALYLAACAGLGPLCLALSPVPAVPLILYSLLKRFTRLCHFGIGLCMALAPVGAAVAASGSLELPPPVLLLAAFAFFWISGFDIIYAMQDIAADRKTGVHSIPAALGAARAERVAAAVHAAAALAALGLWHLAGRGLWPSLALALVVGGFALAYWRRIDLGVRFFPVSVISGVAGAMIPLLGVFK